MLLNSHIRKEKRAKVNELSLQEVKKANKKWKEIRKIRVVIG